MTEEQIKQNAEAYADRIKEIRGELEWCATRDDFIAGAHSRDEEIATLEGLLKIKEHEIKQLRNPWISAEDRLPEGENNPDEYNAPHRVRSSRNVIITDGTIINRGYYSYARMRWEWNEGEIKVTHWMPIQELKKGE